MFSSKEKVAVYIDGSNFYNYLKDKEIGYTKGNKFDYKGFVDYLVGDKRELVSKRYYTGIFRNRDGSQKSMDLVQGQQKFLSDMENLGFAIKRGKILYDGGKPREKGTDVKIAVDILVGTIDNLYDTAILVSSDTDLVPALQYCRYKNKKIEYVGFAHSPSYGIMKNSDLSHLLHPQEIQNFIS